MKKFGIFLITAALIAGMAGCNGGGDYPPCPTPPPSKNLEIQTWYDLDKVRDNLAGNHTLINDLDSTTLGYEELAGPTANQGKGWEPIIESHYGYPIGFVGTFDGQGYEIRDLYINRPGEDYVGLFGSVEGGGVIQNIGMVNAAVSGAEYVGGLVGWNTGTVSNSHSTGSVTGDERVGGLVGQNHDGAVNNSYSSSSVIGNKYVGGLVGENLNMAELVGEATLSNSYSTGSVTGNRWVGGLAGYSSGDVSNSYFTGSVTGERRVGGLAGYSSGNVSNSYFTGSVTGKRLVGGLVGDRSGTISNSYYNYDDVLINGDNIITRGALFDKDFEQWLANDKFLDFNERLSQEDGYYLVNNVTDFKELLAFGENATLKFRLKSDLDLGDDPNFYIPCLAGEFDGNGHKISNLSFNFDFVSHVGLFGYLAPGGKVTQVGVENLNITGTRHVGGLVGWNYGGTVSNCYATGSVTGSATRPELGGYEEYVGGLVGCNGGTVSNSYFTGSVSGLRSVGGLVGDSGVTVSNSHFTGSVVGVEWVGGLVGWNGGNVNNSYSTGTVTGSESVGGLVGTQMLGTVSNCYFTGNVGGYYAEWGDLVGWAIGGLVGSNHNGTVSNSYSTGNVTGRIYVGGLVGWNHVYATVYNSYSTGNVIGDVNVGGLVGQNDSTVSNSFWDIETSGQSTSDGGTGKTTAQMKSLATFSGAGWNINAVGDSGERNPAYIWNIVDDKTYPFLSWQPA